MSTPTRRHPNSRTNRRLAPLLLAAHALTCAPSAAIAQATDPPAPPRDDFSPLENRPDLAQYEGRPIRNLVLQRVLPGSPDDPDAPERIEPLSPSVEGLALNTIRTAEGAPYRQIGVSDDITRLNRTGRFARVTARVQQLADGSVELIYAFVVQPLIEDIQVVGNNQLTDQEIAQNIRLIAGTPVDSLQIDRAARGIEAMYRERGYYLARVTVDQEELDETGVVLFRIREGVRLKVADIRFDGNADFTARQLRKEISTREAWILDRGELDEDILADDVASILGFYQDRGYLDVRIDREITVSPDNTEAIVTFIVEEGPLYTVRDIRLEYIDEAGADAKGPFSVEQMRGVIPLKTGDVYSARLLRDSIDAASEAHGELGYTDVRVRAAFLRDERLPLVDVLVRVRTGPIFKAGLVTVIGNEFTKQKVSVRNVPVRPEEPLNAADLRDAQQRIQGSGLFAPQSVRVEALPESPDDPGYRDVLVEVTETNTGSFNIGALVDSDAGLSG
ncbi:MAG: POTRA domain-containing protein, partial [Planctomycetota bacterium]